MKRKRTPVTPPDPWRSTEDERMRPWKMYEIAPRTFMSGRLYMKKLEHGGYEEVLVPYQVTLADGSQAVLYTDLP